MTDINKMQIFKTSKERENILRKIRTALVSYSKPIPFPDAEKDTTEIFTHSGKDKEEIFADSFNNLGGKFIFCENEPEFLDSINLLYENMSWKQLLCADTRMLKIFHNNKIDMIEEASPYAESADACITNCEALIARTGSILFSSRQNMGRLAPVFFPVHIVFAYADQIVYDIQDALQYMRKKYPNGLPSMLSINSGPSRTADIEKTLVTGVHGPGEVYCFFINVEQ